MKWIDILTRVKMYVLVNDREAIYLYVHFSIVYLYTGKCRYEFVDNIEYLNSRLTPAPY